MVTDLHLERERRAQHRFKLTTRQVTLHASAQERMTIRDILALLDDGAMTRDDAHEAFRALQAQQQRAA